MSSTIPFSPSSSSPPSSSSTSRSVHHVETKENDCYGNCDDHACEAHYDRREQADDDIEKGKLRFSDKLYGRDEELQVLHHTYQRCLAPTKAAGPGNAAAGNVQTPSPTTSSSSSFSPQVIYINGYSGVGKSALVRAFVQQEAESWKRRQRKQQEQGRNDANDDDDDDDDDVLFGFISGKYCEQMTGDPFSAIAEAMNTWIRDDLIMRDHNRNTKTTDRIRTQMERNGFNCNCLLEDDEGANLLNPITSIVIQLVPSAKLVLSINKRKKIRQRRKQDQEKEDYLDSSSRTTSSTASPAESISDEDNIGERAESNPPSLSSSSTTTITTPSPTPIGSSTDMKQHDMGAISHAICSFLRALSSVCPLIMFLDDLQWADASSLELILKITQDRSISNLLLIGSYRSSIHLSSGVAGTTTHDYSEEKSSLEGDDRDKDIGKCNDGTLSRLHTHLEFVREQDYFSTLTVSNLSPRHLTEWIALTLDMNDDEESSSRRRRDELVPLVNVIYSKTLGNAFYVKQALEELVRRNVIYYDVMTFEWNFNLGQQGNNIKTNKLLQDVLSSDVVQMIQSKIMSLPVPLQRALHIMAHINHSVALPVLSACMKADTSNIFSTRTTDGQDNDGTDAGDPSPTSLGQYLDMGVQEGLLFNSSKRRRMTERNQHNRQRMRVYKFVHDKIQEAAYTLLPPGPDKDLIRVRIAHVLTGIATFNSIGIFAQSRRASNMLSTASQFRAEQGRMSQEPHKGRSYDAHEQHGINIADDDAEENQFFLYNDSFDTDCNVPTDKSQHDGDDDKTERNNSYDDEEENSFLNSYDWMLFVAVHHFNNVPMGLIPDPLRLAKLNLQVANLCLARASFVEAVRLLRSAVNVLLAESTETSTQATQGDSSTNDVVAKIDVKHVQENSRQMKAQRYWKDHYGFMLKLYDRWMSTEFAAGNMEETRMAIDQVLEHANSDKDRSAARYTHVAMTVEVNKGNFELGIIESINYLATLGQKIPTHPTRYDILQERLKLKFALGVRSVSVLSELPIMEDDSMMKLLGQLALLSNKSRNEMLTTFVTLRVMRLSLEEGRISKSLPQILTTYSVPLRQSGQYDTAYSYAAIVERIFGRFPQEVQSSAEFAVGRIILHSGVLPLRTPFADSIDVLVDLYRIAMAAGSINMAFAAAMHFPLLYYACGLPLNNPLLEPKLILYEEKAKQLYQDNFTLVFQSCRQFLYNLQGKPGNDNATELQGEVMDEMKVLDRLEGNDRKMSLRDMSILRMALSFIFLDEEGMEQMSARLSTYPLFDLPIVREHLRLCYNGMAAIYLGRKNHDKEYLDLGHTILKKLKRLDKTVDNNGNSSSNSGDRNMTPSNTGPVIACLKALERNKQSAYDEAIRICKSAKLLHLEAMMNEHCALMFFDGEESKKKRRNRHQQHQQQEQQQQQQEKVEPDLLLAKEYMRKAMCLYSVWGAFAKVEQLTTRYRFLLLMSTNSQQSQGTWTVPATKK